MLLKFMEVIPMFRDVDDLIFGDCTPIVSDR